MPSISVSSGKGVFSGIRVPATSMCNGIHVTDRALDGEAIAQPPTPPPVPSPRSSRCLRSEKGADPLLIELMSCTGSKPPGSAQMVVEELRLTPTSKYRFLRLNSAKWRSGWGSHPAPPAGLETSRIADIAHQVLSEVVLDLKSGVNSFEFCLWYPAGTAPSGCSDRENCDVMQGDVATIDSSRRRWRSSPRMHPIRLPADHRLVLDRVSARRR